jgi:hypothetical protein
MSISAQAIPCQRCGISAGLASTIAPFGNTKGARIYGCTECQHFTWVGAAVANNSNNSSSRSPTSRRGRQRMPRYRFALQGHDLPLDQFSEWFPNEVEALKAGASIAAELAVGKTGDPDFDVAIPAADRHKKKLGLIARGRLFLR